LLALCFFASIARGSVLTQADSDLQQGRVDVAAAALQQVLRTQPQNALAHQLLCRVYYSQDMADPAVQECEFATASEPSNSQNHLWLARAYGLKASHANPLKALGLAKKVHEQFESAVRLDSHNVHAMSDLGEFYVAAPSIVGGGLDKARELAARMQPLFPAQAHRILALIAVKSNDLPTAEAEFKAAVTVARSPEAYIDLASFYAQHNHAGQAVAMIDAALSADSARSAPHVDAASILTSLHRSPDLAERSLREYLASPAKSDEAPAFKVHLQLGQILARQGETAAANREYAAAVALASGYTPARKALQST
jgi:predicted Zn-dependent protease